MVVQSHDADRRHLVSPAVLALRWSVSRSTLRRWARDGRGPQPVKLSGGTIRYRLSEVERWERAAGGDAR